MSNTHNALLQASMRGITASFLIAGIMALVTSSADRLTAQVTHQGSSVIQTGIPTELAADPMHSVAFLPESNSGKLFFIGILLVIAGLLFHAWTVLRFERPVHISIQKKKREEPKILYQHFVVWLDKEPRQP